MWEKFKDWFGRWFQSDHFPWCMFGFELGQFLVQPTWITTGLLAFWIWVLWTMEQE